MLDPLFNFFEKLIDQFSWRRLIFVALILVLSSISLIVFESYTGHFRLSKIEKTVDIIAKLNELPPDITKQGRESIINTTKILSQDLESFSGGNSTPFSINVNLLKVIAALAPWLLFAAILPLTGNNGSKEALIGIIVCAIPSGIIGFYLPLFAGEWVNYVAFPFGYFIVAVALVMLWHKRK